MKRSLGAALLSSAALMVVVPSVASGASVVNSQTRVYPGADTPVFVTSARGLTCRAAARQQGRYRWTGKNTFTTPGGYRRAPSGHGAIGYQLRCVKGSRAYRTEFQD